MFMIMLTQQQTVLFIKKLVNSPVVYNCWLKSTIATTTKTEIKLSTKTLLKFGSARYRPDYSLPIIYDIRLHYHRSALISASPQ